MNGIVESVNFAGMATFAQKLQMLMDDRSTNPNKLWEEYGVRPQTLGAWLKEKNKEPVPPSIDNLAKITSNLECSADWLLSDDDEPVPPREVYQAATLLLRLAADIVGGPTKMVDTIYKAAKRKELRFKRGAFQTEGDKPSLSAEGDLGTPSTEDPAAGRHLGRSMRPQEEPDPPDPAASPDKPRRRVRRNSSSD